MTPAPPIAGPGSPPARLVENPVDSPRTHWDHLESNPQTRAHEVPLERTRPGASAFDEEPSEGLIGPRPASLLPDENAVPYETACTQINAHLDVDVFRSSTETCNGGGLESPVELAGAAGGPFTLGKTRGSSLPTARQIIESARAAEVASETARRRVTAHKHLRPTEVGEPDAWKSPRPRLMHACAFVAALSLGLPMLALNLVWTIDRLSLAAFENQLLAGERLPSLSDCDLAAKRAGGDRPWWQTTAWESQARVLARQRSALRSQSQFSQVHDQLDLVRHIRRGDPAARLNQVLLGQTTSAPGNAQLVEALGLSRDAASLATLARLFLAAKRPEPAIAATRAALRIALTNPPPKAKPPQFLEDPNHPRYLLPGEYEVTEILQGLSGELVATQGTDWIVDALPRSSLVTLAAWNCLKARNPTQAAAVLARWSGTRPTEEKTPADRQGDDPSPARELAAEAELHAAAGQWSLATVGYQHAIAVAKDDVLRRSWYLNLADAYGHASDTARQRSCLESAEGKGLWDDVTQRSLRAQVPETQAETAVAGGRSRR